jgi:hypothetical protein
LQQLNTETFSIIRIRRTSTVTAHKKNPKFLSGLRETDIVQLRCLQVNATLLQELKWFSEKAN